VTDRAKLCKIINEILKNGLVGSATPNPSPGEHDNPKPQTTNPNNEQRTTNPKQQATNNKQQTKN
jgi:hypothetical protein